MVKKVWQTDRQTDRQTDGRTDWTSDIAAWSQLKITLCDTRCITVIRATHAMNMLDTTLVFIDSYIKIWLSCPNNYRVLGSPLHQSHAWWPWYLLFVLPPLCAGNPPIDSHHQSYRQVSSISRILVGNKIVDNSDVVGASPVDAAPTTSSLSI